jgi:hypothetical protein
MSKMTDMSKNTGLKLLAIAALFAVTGSAQAQVYGTNDNPYEVNPFASNMVVPPDPTATPAAPPATSSPVTTPAVPQQQNAPQQTGATASNSDPKKETKP